MGKRCLATAMNNEQQETSRIGIAINIAMPEDGAAPEWVELLPPDEIVAGIDGRTWVNDNPQLILDHFNRLKAHNRDLPIDWEHATEHKAPHGDPAPAAAWGVSMENREGRSIWVKADWTPRGRESVVNREYRYLSPVLVYEKATRRIVGIDSVGLTSKPNIKLQALNREGQQHQEEVMKKIYTKLGLAETATEDEALNAITTLQSDLATATNRAETPSLDKFVPRTDYDQAVTRATNAEQKLADHEKADQETAINAEIDKALAAGKIAPASKDFYLATCRAEGGLDSFRKYIETAPVIAKPSDLDNKETGAEGVALNADQQKIATMFGNSAEDIKKYGQA